jgi:transcriptional regulator NrdR family protein
MSQINPLQQYFRQPAIYARLPSGGKFYPPGTIDMPPNNELPVYPMTAIDEIIYRTPDALFNGQATVNVIQSCVPNIKDAWAIPAMDVDSLLISIRIASYGHELEFGTTCPKCQHESEQGLDLRGALDRISPPDYNKCIRHGDMEIYFRPMTYQNLNDNNRVQFENQKMLQQLPDAETDDMTTMSALGAALKKITEITVNALSQSIAAIKTPQALVSEPEFIEEFLKQCDRKLFNQIRDHIVDLKNQAELQPLSLACPNCNHKYEQAITLDMTSFFEPAS